MNHTSDHITAVRRLAYLEAATRLLDLGNVIAAREITETALTYPPTRFTTMESTTKIEDLHAYICLKERMGVSSDTVTILGRHYFAGASANCEHPMTGLMN